MAIVSAAGEFADLDDVSVLGCFKAWRDSGDTLLSRLCSGLLDRRLYKTIDLSHRDDPAEASRVVVESLGEGEAFYDSAANASYRPGDAGIRVEGGGDLSDASPLVRALATLGADDRFHRLHVRSERVDEAMRLLG